MDIRIKRVYEMPSPQDGMRILVDRLWPRGLTKEKAHVDLWLKELAPSIELRKWFNHEPEKWEEFRQRYWQELALRPAALERVDELIGMAPVTLLFGSRDERFNGAVALKTFMLARDR